jgi:hypothetical protein
LRRGALRNRRADPPIAHCRCSQRRKAQGSAFATNGTVGASGFSLLSGAGHLAGDLPQCESREPSRDG